MGLLTINQDLYDYIYQTTFVQFCELDFSVEVAKAKAMAAMDESFTRPEGKVELETEDGL